MLYAVVTHEEVRRENLGALLYLRSLALAGYPFRIMWSGMFCDPGEMSQALAPLQGRFGFRERATAMLYCGGVHGAAHRIAHPDECPERNYALVTWPTDAIPPHLIHGMLRYDRVLVPPWEAPAFEALGDQVVTLPWPAPTAEERRAPRLIRPTTVRRLVGAVGAWSGEGQLGLFVRAFLQRFTKKQGYGLVISCPEGIPRDGLREAAAGLARENLPLLHVVPFPCREGLDDPAGLDGVLGSCDLFVNTSHHYGGHFWARRARSLGVPVVEPDKDLEIAGSLEAPLNPMTVRSRWRYLNEGVWANVLDQVEQSDWTHALDVLPGEPPKSPEEAGRAIVEILEGRLFAGSPVKPPRLEEWKPKLLVVVPVMGGSLGTLDRCLRALIEARKLYPADLVLSIQGDVKGPSGLARVRGVPCCRSLPQVSPEGRWNLSAARNAGVRYAREKLQLEPDFVVFIDADVTVPPSHLRDLVQQARRGPRITVTPRVQDEDGSHPRIASGLTLYPVEPFEAARGFDEEFWGWGYEDLDLLFRLREQFGVGNAQQLGGAPCLHVPHPKRLQQDEDDQRNLIRYQTMTEAVAGGATVIVNVVPGGWGQWEEINAPR